MARGSFTTVQFRGEMRSYAEVSEITGVHVNTLRVRHAAKVPLDAPLNQERVSKQVEFRGELMSLVRVAELTGLSQCAVRLRLKRGLALDAPEVTAIMSNRTADFDIDGEMSWDCVDEVVERHPDGITLDQVGVLIGRARERVRQIQNEAIKKLRVAAKRGTLSADMQALLDAFTSLDAAHRIDPLDALPALEFYWTGKRAGRQKKAG